jgi:uncharacterized protein
MSLARHTRRIVLVLSLVAISSATRIVAGPAETWRAETEAWRAKREQSLRAPDGWLTVSGLFFLKPGVNTVGADAANDIVLPEGGAPADAGRVILDGRTVRYEPVAGVAATVNQQPISGPIELSPGGEDGARPADRVTIGRVSIHLHRSGQRLAIRLRDPEGPLRTQFAGLKWYPIDERWRVTASFTPYDTPRKVPVQNVLGDVIESIALGEAAFDVNGEQVRLVAFKEGTHLWFVFSDATSKSDTYRIRFLAADPPDAQGHLQLDFNRAYNPPCAYNPNTTCPLPIAQNRLKIAIPAGEQRAPHPGVAAILRVVSPVIQCVA